MIIRIEKFREKRPNTGIVRCGGALGELLVGVRLSAPRIVLWSLRSNIMLSKCHVKNIQQNHNFLGIHSLQGESGPASRDARHVLDRGKDIDVK